MINLSTGLFGVAAFGGLIAMAGDKLKTFCGSLSNMAFINVKLDWDLVPMVMYYLHRNYKAINLSSISYIGRTIYVIPTDRVEIVPFRHVSESSQLFVSSGKVILFTKSVRDSSYSGRDTSYKLSFLRGTLDPDKLICDAIAAYTNRMDRDRVALDEGHTRLSNSKRFMVTLVQGKASSNNDSSDDSDINGDRGTDFWLGSTIPISWGFDQIGSPVIAANAFCNIAMSPEHDIVLQDVKFWLENKKWYMDHGVPWKRGFLLHGEPGNGKTSLIRALGVHFDLPVYIFDLSTINNRMLQVEWKKASKDAPCIILVEDIDGIFHGRENVVNTSVMENKLTFDFLLNTIDGVEEFNGVLLFITTNNISLVDPAIGCVQESSEVGMASRPGRIDRVVKISPPSAEGRWDIAQRILGEASEEAEDLVSKGTHCSAAQFVDLCQRTAVQKKWDAQRGVGKSG